MAAILLFAGLSSSDAVLWGKERKNPGGKPLASVNGVPITETQARMDGAADLDSLELQMLRSKATLARNEHEILEQAVEHLIEQRLIEAEAAKRGISKDELLAKEIQQNTRDVTPEEIDAFYNANKQRIKKPKEEVAAQIGNFLKEQRAGNAREAFLKKLEKQHQVTRSLEPLRSDVDATGRPSVGPAKAPIVLVLFLDYQCPYCKGFEPTIKEVLKRYGDKVRLVYRQFPLTSIHPYAQRAAEAVLCAAAQNHFSEMHASLIQNQSSLQEENIRGRASKLGLDANAFNTCLSTARYGAMIHEDLRAAAIAGVEGTPTLYINGRYVNGVRPYEEVAAIIDEELAKKK